MLGVWRVCVRVGKVAARGNTLYSLSSRMFGVEEGGGEMCPKS